MLWKRVVSAVIPLPLILACIHYAPTWAWALMVALFTSVAHFEFLTITAGGRSFGERLAQTLLGVVAIVLMGVFPGRFTGEIVACAILVPQLWVLFSPGEMTTAFPRAAAITTGYFYVVGLMSFLVWLHLLPSGPFWLYVAFFVAWAGDTGAYFAGRAFGKHKLYPLVSPKKTWEGAIGGLLGSLGGVLLAKVWFFPALTFVDCALIALPGGAIGQMGDLCESLLKRSYDVKDSGTIMPGHGGILDRADALMFVMPWVYLYAVRFHPIAS
jgi:phosphatidate cytidylyltransferase